MIAIFAPLQEEEGFTGLFGSLSCYMELHFQFFYVGCPLKPLSHPTAQEFHSRWAVGTQLLGHGGCLALLLWLEHSAAAVLRDGTVRVYSVSAWEAEGSCWYQACVCVYLVWGSVLNYCDNRQSRKSSRVWGATFHSWQTLNQNS